ncbi:hypothetical protein CATMIT_01613, partial [Catenibacterium mitsuokai DSM 15897]
GQIAVGVLGDVARQARQAERRGPAREHALMRVELPVGADGPADLVELLVVIDEHARAGEDLRSRRRAQVHLLAHFGPTLDLDLLPAHAGVDAQLLVDLPFVRQVQRLRGGAAAGVFPLITVAVHALVGQRPQRPAGAVHRHQIQQARVVAHIGQHVRGIAVEILIELGVVIAQGHIVALPAEVEAAHQARIADELVDRHGDAAQAGDGHQAVAVLVGRVEHLARRVDVAQLRAGRARHRGDQLLHRGVVEELGAALQGQREHAVALGPGFAVAQRLRQLEARAEVVVELDRV